ncbi:MAG: hypothetical protein Pars2KO_33550 [Parasphingorhabdus sp.]
MAMRKKKRKGELIEVQHHWFTFECSLNSPAGFKEQLMAVIKKKKGGTCLRNNIVSLHFDVLEQFCCGN